VDILIVDRSAVARSLIRNAFQRLVLPAVAALSSVSQMHFLTMPASDAAICHAVEGLLAEEA
jgi:hypothetical protein